MEKLYDILINKGKDIKSASESVIDLKNKEDKVFYETHLSDKLSSAYTSNGQTDCFFIKQADKYIIIPCVQTKTEFVKEYTYFIHENKLKIIVINSISRLKRMITIDFEA